MWLILALAVGLCVAVLLSVLARRPAARASPDVDPLFVAGISITGASAALVATSGMAMLPMMLVGLVCVAIGLRRTRGHPDEQH